MTNWTIRDTETGDTWEKDSRKEAENAIEMFGDERDLELLAPGETAATDGGAAVADNPPHDHHGNPVADQEEEDVVEADAEVVDESVPEQDERSQEEPPAPPTKTEAIETPQQNGDGEVQLQGDESVPLEDPLSMLPGWMITEVSYDDRGDSSTTVNKRGCQVIAEFLGLEMVERNIIKRAHETEFEYATYEITMKKPDGREFTGVGTARADNADQGENAGWKLDMMAETRAYKRSVKSATGGGIEAFAKEGDH